jgi:UTP--glucose-1-phosphate uridylyltransferase
MKGVIVAAGYGTRFLPVTKTVPKEMLPLLSKPTIAYIVEEFIASGIRDIVIVSSRRKKSMEDYFDREIELESVFEREGKADKARAIAPYEANFSFVRQAEMRGTGHALLQVRELVRGGPCVVAYPDDVHFGEKPLALQLIEAHEKTGCSVLATIHEAGDVSRYGVVDPDPDGIHARGMVEKPAPGAEPSHEVSIGRYLYTEEFFELLAEGWKGFSGGEYYHVGALSRLMSEGKVVFARAEGQRLDTGEPSGYLEALLYLASRDPALKKVFADCAQRFL